MELLEQRITRYAKDIENNIKNVSKGDRANGDAEKIIDEIDKNIKESLSVVFNEFSEQTLVFLAETILKVESRLQVAEFYIDYYLTSIQSESQFAVQFRLLKAQLIAKRAKNSNVGAEQKLKMINQSLDYIHAAINIINKPSNRDRLSFMVYNTSLVVFNIMEDYFRAGFFDLFTNLCDKLNDLLKIIETDEYNWCGQFSWVLFCCMIHTDKKQEALKLLDRIWEKSKKKNYIFHEVLFRQRIVMCKVFPQLYSVLQKEVSKENDYMKSIFMLQALKVGLIPENSIEKELNGLLKSLNCVRLGGEEHDIKTLSENNQVIYAEIARVASHYGIASMGRQLTAVIKKTKNFSIKAQMITEFAVAELKAVAGVEDKKLIGLQLKEQLVSQRKEAIYGLSKSLRMINIVKDPWLLYEGCLLLWNLSLPFLNDAYRSHVYKPFKTAIELQEIYMTNDYATRIKMLIELSKVDKSNRNYQIAYDYICKALDLSNYILNCEFKAKLEFMYDELALLIGYKGDDWNALDKAQIKLNSINKLRHESAKRESLFHIIQTLGEIGEQPFCIIPTNIDMDEDDISKQEEAHKQKQKLLYVQRIHILSKVAHTAFNCHMFDVMTKAAQEVIKDKWDLDHQELIIQQSLCHVFIADSLIRKLMNEGYEFAFADHIRFDSDSKYKEIKSEELDELKINIMAHYEKALELAISIKQYWLVFNGAINIWNNYLPVFKNSLNDSKLHPNVFGMLEKYFNALKEAIKEIERRKIVDYELENKTQIYGNIALIFARLLEARKEYKEVMYVCEELLLSPLGSQTRKLVNSTRARIAGFLEVDKGNKKSKASGLVTDKKDQILYDIITKLEIIQNVNSNQSSSQNIKDCYDLLLKWKETLAPEFNHELTCELWTKLGNFAYNEDTIEFHKLSVHCLDQALEGENTRWLALAHLLYGKVMVKLAGPDHLLFKGLEHTLEALNKALECNNQRVFMDSLSQFCRIIDIIEQKHYTKENSSCLVKPLFSAVYYMKLASETFNDLKKNIDSSKMSINMLILLYKGCNTQEDFEILEMTAKVLLELVASEFKKDIWIIRMHGIERIYKSETEILKVINECSPHLQACLLTQLAYNSKDTQKQYFGFTKAVEILRKENDSEVTAVMLELAEWMLLNGFKLETVREHILSAIDLLIEKMHCQVQQPILESIVQAQGNSFYPLYSRTFRGKASEHLNVNEIVADERNNKATSDTLNIIEYDRLFRAHMMLATISPNYYTKLDFTQDAVQFLAVILKKTIEKYRITIKTEINSDSLEYQELPATTYDWLAFKYNNEFHELIEYSKDAIIFCKSAFEKPSLTFYYLLKCIDTYISEGIYYECVLLLKYAELFTRHIINNQKALAYVYCELANVSIQLDLNDFKKHYNECFEDLSNDSMEYFNEELDKLKISLQTNTVAFYNYSQETKKEYEFKETIYNFEFWIRIGRLLYLTGQLDRSNKYITAFIQATSMANLDNLKGEGILLQAYIFYYKNDLSSCRKRLDTAKYYIKTLDTWLYYLEITKRLFIKNDRILELYAIFNKIEQLVTEIDKKTGFESTRIVSNDIKMNIKLMNCEIIIKKFNDFLNSYNLESPDLYKKNLKNLFDNVQENLNGVLELSSNGINQITSQKIVIICYEMLKIIQNVKIVQISIFKFLYINIETFNSLVLDCHHVIQNIYNHIKENRLKLTNPIYRDNSSIAITQQLYNLKYIWVRTLNEMYNLRDMFESIHIPFYLTDMSEVEDNCKQSCEKLLDGKSLSIEKKRMLTNIQKFMNDKITRKTIQKQTSMAQVFLDELVEITPQRNHLFLEYDIKLENILTKLYKEKLIAYIDDNSFQGVEISEDLGEKNLNDQTNINKKLKTIYSDLNEIILPLKYVEFVQYLSMNYFEYNLRRLKALIEININNIDPEYIFDYQSIIHKKALLEFIISYSKNEDIMASKIARLVYERDSKLYEEIKENNLLKFIFALEPLKDNLNSIKEGALHLALQVDNYDNKFYMAAIYKNMAGKIIQKAEVINNASELILGLNFFTKSVFDVNISSSMKEFPINIQNLDGKDDNDNEQNKADGSYTTTNGYIDALYHNNDINMDPLKKFIESFLLYINEKETEEEATKPNKQKSSANSLNEIVFYVPLEFTTYPFEKLMKHYIENTLPFTKCLSFDSYLRRIKRDGSNKINMSNSYAIATPLGEFANITEISQPYEKINDFVESTNLKEGDTELSTYKWDKSIESKDILVISTLYPFNSNYNFGELIKYGYNQNSKVNLLIIADSMKINDEEFKKKYIDIAYEFKINRSKLLLLAADILGVDGIILPYDCYTSEEIIKLFDDLKLYANDTMPISKLNLLNERYPDFSYFGVPNMCLQPQKKSK